jgi:hypothetical protein
MRSVHVSRKMLFALSFLLLCSGLAVSHASAVTTSTTTTTAAQPAQASLALSVLPPKLPADGGSYPAVVVSLTDAGGNASLALTDTTVFLTSSEENVGTISSDVMIAAGTGFAVANFTTTAFAGTTSISASSVGLESTSVQLTTVTPSGFPTHLKVIPVPGAQLVNPTGSGTIIVETLDSVGLPAKAISGVSVSLSSSNDNVVSLPATSLTVPSGAVLASSTYDTGVIPGTSTITASASGFNSGSGLVSVSGPSPFDLKIFAQPDPIVTSATGRLVVTVTDQQGDPARAPAPIQVTITSSNNTVAASQETAIIQAGEIYAVVPFTSGSIPGTANLTASSPGLLSDFALVTVDRPAHPTMLNLLAAPNPFLADGRAYDSVVVALTDASGGPATTSSNLAVTLTSSNSPVGSVNGSVTIDAGSSYAVATFTSTLFVGSAFITASAQNLLSATSTVSSYGSIPSKVVVQALPATLPADGGNYSALEVILEDSTGSPAVAAAGVPVQLASSNPGIASVNSSVVIRAGQTYALTDILTSISPGTANINATSSGFDTSSTLVTTISPAQSQLAVYVAPVSGIQSLGGGADALLAVQLQTSNSSPASARQNTPIVVTDSNSSVLAKPLQLSIATGEDYAFAYIKTSSPGTSELTASTSGLAAADATLSVLSIPISVNLTASAPVVAMGETATLTLEISVLGSPLSGANVTLTATSGAVTPPQGVTDSAGQFTSTFIPTADGVATVTASVHDSLLGNQSAGTNILVTLAGPTGSLPVSRGLGLLGSFLPIVLVVVIIVIIALGARRILKSRRGAPDEGEETVPDL